MAFFSGNASATTHKKKRERERVEGIGAVHHGRALLPTAAHFYDESLPKAEIHIQAAAALDGKTLDGRHYKEGGP